MSDQPISHVSQLLDREDDRLKKRQYSFYIRDSVYKRFMEVCKKRGLSGSKVISAMMRDFIETYDTKK
jgi:hypothetical protein